MNSVLLLLVGFVALSLAADRAYFAPYGPANGDATLYRNDDEYTDAVPLIGGMFFFGQNRQYLYVDNNGIITLDAQLRDYTPSSMSTLTIPAIAPYWADVDTRPSNGGYLYYRSTLDPTVTSSLSSFIRATQTGSTFAGTRAFVATWIDVGYYNQKVNKRCTFQVALIADDFEQTYAIFNYGDMQWTTGDASGGSNGLGGVPAAVGFSKGSGGVYAQLGESLTGDIINVGTRTNAYINGVPQIGQYVFSVSSGVTISVCCNTANPPTLTNTPAVLTHYINTINDANAQLYTGTVTATYQCTNPATATITPDLFVVYGCPVTQTWSATDSCGRRTDVVNQFIYPEVFSEPLQMTVPADYSVHATSCYVPSVAEAGTATSNRGANGVIDHTDSVPVSNGHGCTMTRYWIAQDICNVFQYGQQSITIDTSTPATTRAQTTGDITTGDITTGDITTQPLTTQPLTSGDITTQPLTTGDITTQPLTTQPLTTKPLTTKPLTTQPLTTDFRTVADRCASFSQFQTMPETQGWFCSNDHRGYYQCLKGPWASQARLQSCPSGTSCKCAYGVECLSAMGAVCTYGAYVATSGSGQIV